MQVYTDYDEALAELPEGWHLSGCYKGDEPRYFHSHPDVTDAELEAMAFEIRNGRPMSQIERSLWATAKQIRDGVPA